MEDAYLVELPLGKRHKTALRELSSECEYDREGFIERAKLGPGIGDKTMSDLLEWGLIIQGQCKYREEIGYRITELGERANLLKASTFGSRSRRASTASRRLKPLAPRLKHLPPRSR